MPAYEEFTYWMAYFQIEGWGPFEENIQQAMIGSACVSVHTKKPVKPDAFMTPKDKYKGPKDWRELRDTVHAIAGRAKRG